MKYKPRFGKMVFNGYSCVLCKEPLYHNDPERAHVCVSCTLQRHIKERISDWMSRGRGKG